MSVNFEDIIKQGPVRIKRSKLPLWKSRHMILKKPSSKGPLRIECFQDEKTSQLTDSKKKVIDLKNIKSIIILPPSFKRHALAIVFDDEKVLQMALASDSEMLSWHVALQGICLPSARPPTAPSGMDLLSCASESSSQDVFNVYLLPNLALSIHGECLLQCTTETLYMLDVENPTRRIIGWPLNTLRRYGRDSNMFTFECGRSCPTGECIFIFNTIYGEQIYQKVHSASVAISMAYGLSATGQGKTSGHRALARSGTLPVMPRESVGGGGLPIIPPPRRQASLRRQSTVDRRRPLPPPPPIF